MTYEELKKKNIIDENDEVWIEKVKSKVHFSYLNDDCTDFVKQHIDHYGKLSICKEWFWKFCQKHYGNSTPKKYNYGTVLNEVADILIRNYNDNSKRVKGVRKNLLIKEIKEKNKELNTGIVSRAIKKMCLHNIIQIHQQTKYKKLVIKGNYWNSHIKEKKNDK